MSNYQILVLFCRAFGNFLICYALFCTLNMAGGFRVLLDTILIRMLIYNLPFLGLGFLLRAFASTIATTVTGRSAFEGEALSREFEKSAEFKQLSRAITGLALIAFGVIGLFNGTLMFYFYSGSLFGGSPFKRWETVEIIRLAALMVQPILGGILAFGPALKNLAHRIIRPNNV